MFWCLAVVGVLLVTLVLIRFSFGICGLRVGLLLVILVGLLFCVIAVNSVVDVDRLVCLCFGVSLVTLVVCDCYWFCWWWLFCGGVV